MKKFNYAFSNSIFRWSNPFIFSLLIGLCFSVNLQGQCSTVPGTIKGSVFIDADEDGVRDSGESGISGVLVNVYDGQGNQAGSAITSGLGDFSISGFVDGNEYLVTYTNPAGYQSTKLGVDSKSSVTSVTVPACDATYGVVPQKSLCGSNPDLLLTCFVQGTVDENSNVETIVQVEHDFTGNSTVEKFAMHGQTGAVWGIVHHPGQNAIYTAAFVKQYSGLKYGPYAILKTDPVTKTTSKWIDISELLPDLNLEGLTITDPNNCDYGDQVGRQGLGALVLSDDFSMIYTTVLDKNIVVGIPMDNPSADNVEIYQIPRPADIPANEEFKIFALTIKNNHIYVGGTVTGAVARDADVSEALVMSINLSDGNILPEFRMPIKGYWQDGNPADLNASQWLTDISFSDEGNMILSLSDRVGHRYCKAGNNRLDQQYPDIVMVGKDPQTGAWVLESNGSIPGFTGSGVGNGEGPGGGEFFGFDNWPANPVYHNETAIGSAFVLPGSGEVVVSVYDPMMNSYSGGLHRYSTVDGSKTGAIELYVHAVSPQFGKATGFGDITAKCIAPSIEIGNLVWDDENGNGMQDAGEEGIGGVRLDLYDANCNLIDSTTTGDDGVYSFNVTMGSSYFVALEGQLYDPVNGLYHIGGTDYVACLGGDGNGADNIDCDISFIENSCLGFPAIEINSNENNHTFDIGLATPIGMDLALNSRVNGDCFASIGGDLTYDIEVINQGSTVAGRIKVVAYLTPGLSFDSAKNPGWEQAGSFVTTWIESDLVAGAHSAVSLTLDVIAEDGADYILYAEIAEIRNIADEVVGDIDSTPDTIMENDKVVDDEIFDDGTIDEDDQDIAEACIFDLAARITLDDDKIYYKGDVVKFNITIFNQGNTGADFIQLTNYFPEELSFRADLNDQWALDGATVKLIDNMILDPGQSREYCLFFEVDGNQLPKELVDYIEISQSSPVGDLRSMDIDSTPDDTRDNDMGGEPHTFTDNIVTDRGVIDEDDQDPVVLRTNYVDLALIKYTDHRRVRGGESVDFTIEIFNQGSAPIQSVEVVDFIPEFMTLEDDTWTMIGQNTATKSIIFDQPVFQGMSYKTTITLKVDDNISPQYFVNYAEIKGARSLDNLEIAAKDIDSTPDALNGNDAGGVPSTNTDNVVIFQNPMDEDDHDPARVFAANSSLVSTCLGNATNATNGQYRDDFTITAPSGQGWYVEAAVNYYDISSPAPPGAPIPIATGNTALLLETSIGGGMSNYTISAIRLTGQNAQISFKNTNGDIETIDVPAEQYGTIQLDGNFAVCAGSGALEQYVVSNPAAGVDYTFSLPDGGNIDSLIGTTGIVVDWSGLPASDNYHINVVPSNGCVAPYIATVDLGRTSGTVSCLGNMNISLPGDCNIEVIPELILTGDIDPNAGYFVMLTTPSGEVIPNAILTAEHIGMTVTAKVIDACSGNSCWSFLLVEDKMPPKIDCQDAFVACNKVDQFVGPFVEDNCGGDVSMEILNETINTLDCDSLYNAEIIRTYQAVDNQGRVSEPCTMTIHVERVNLDSIIFPDSLLISDGTALSCNNFEANPDGTPTLAAAGIPTYLGEPVIPDFGVLCNTAVTYKDEVKEILGKVFINRKFTAWEWNCGGTNKREYTQVIIITDTEPPVITCPDDITIFASENNCSGAVELPLPASLSDACTSVTWTIETPLAGLIKEGDSRIIQLPYQVNPYQFIYNGIDAAGNTASCMMTVTVKDNVAPVPLCKNFPTIGVNTQGIAYMYPGNIDNGSYDNCGPVTLDVRLMDSNNPFSDKVIFDCTMVGDTVNVVLRATDIGGLTNTCMVGVIVQDKIPPVVSGPADVTIDCGDNYEPISQFGAFSFDDVCSVDTTMIVHYNINDCGTGTITRTLVATDGTNTVSATQVITIVNTSPFDGATIDWPDDFEITVNTCNLGDILDPENLPANRGLPRYTFDGCDMVVTQIPVDQDEYTLINDPNNLCKKIIRHWVVMDMCHQITSDSFATFTHNQIIKIFNEKTPEIVTSVTSPVTLLSNNCTDAQFDMTVEADDCDPDVLQWMIQVDLNQDFIQTSVYDTIIMGQGSAATISMAMPIGTHDVVYTFTNPCGHSVTVLQTVEVLFGNIPMPTCQDINTDIKEWIQNGDTLLMACVTPDILIDKVDHCPGMQIALSFSPTDLNDTLKCFTCDEKGLNEITVYAIDVNDPTKVGSCTATLDVQDNFNLCPETECAVCPDDFNLTADANCQYTVTDNSFDAGILNDPDCSMAVVSYTITGSTNYTPGPDSTSLVGTVFGVGVFNITWTVLNNNGFPSICEQVITVEDGTVPSVSCVDFSFDLDIIAAQPGCMYTLTNSVDPDVLDNCSAMGLVVVNSANNTSSLDGYQLGIGTHQITWTVTDAAGNSSTCVQNIQVNPIILCNTTDITVNLDNNNMASITVSDLIDINTTCVDSVNITLSQSEFDCNDVGTNVTVTLTGDYLVSPCTAVVTVEEGNVPTPELTCAPAMTISLGIDDGDTTDCVYTIFDDRHNPISFETSAGCQDNLFPVWSIDSNSVILANTANTIIGQELEPGIHTIYWFLVGSNGTTYNSCTTQVTVVDDVAPDCIEQGIIDITLSVENYTITVADLPNPYTDACGPVDVIFSPPTLSCQNEGLMDVTATVTDSIGNSSSCPIQFNVIVPNSMFECNLSVDTVYIDSLGEASITVDDVIVTGGVCGAQGVVTLSQSTFFCNDVSISPIAITINVDGNLCSVDSLVVLDTIAPTITCNPDVTISCVQFDLDYGGSVLDLLAGIELIDSTWDNCTSATTTSSVVSDVNACSFGTFTRTATIEDPLSGQSDQCTQVLTISGPIDPLSQSDVDAILPSSVTIEGCTYPDDFNTDTMTVADVEIFADCGLFDVSFTDSLLSNDGCTVVVERTYTILAPCQDENTFEFVQTITMTDTIDPVILPIPDTTIQLLSGCEGMIDLSGLVSASDNCDSLTFTNDGPGQGVNQNSDDPSGVYEMGTYTITITATDGCGNSATDTFNVEVLGNNETSWTCNKPVAVLDSLTLTDTIDISEIIMYQPGCTSDTTFLISFVEDQFDSTYLVVDCSQKDTPIKIDTIFIWSVVNGDTTGYPLPVNCIGEIGIVDVQDPSGGCPSPPGISGNIFTPTGEGIPQYEIGLIGSDLAPVYSSVEGGYAFPAMPPGGSYRVLPRKDDDLLNGVSTLDLLLIQRHILELSTFENAYQYIAADIDNNGRLTGADLVALRKAILGVTTSFPNNESWKALDASYAVPEDANPLDMEIPNDYKIVDLSNDMDIDFVAVKIGDINGNVNLSGKNGIGTSRAQTILRTKSIKNEVEVYSDDLREVAGLQFGINTGMYELLDIKAKNSQNADVSFVETSAGIYNIIITWKESIKVDADAPVFTMVFDCKTCYGLDRRISLNTDIMAPEIYTGQELETRVFAFNSMDVSSEADRLFALQNTPNPWSDKTSVSLRILEDSDVQFNIYDVTGKMVYHKTLSLKAGIRKITIDDRMVSQSGVYYYEFSTSKESVRAKMIKLQ